MFNTRNHRTKDLLNIWKLSLMCKYLASASKVMIKNIWWLNNTKVPNMITLLSLFSLVHDSASTMLLGRVQGCNRWGQLGAGHKEQEIWAPVLIPIQIHSFLQRLRPARQAPARSPGPANFFPSSYRKLLHNTSLHLQTLQHTTQKIFRADADACLLLYARNINISDNFLDAGASLGLVF